MSMLHGEKLRRWANYVADCPPAVHTIPLRDSAPHEESLACPCGPRVHRYGEGMQVIHNSWDGREILERAIVEGF